MKITIIGSGNVAAVIGGKAKAAGHDLLQVAARREAAAAALAGEWGCGYTTQLEAVDPGADLYIVAVSDNSLPAVSGQLLLPGRLIVHTAGAVAGSVLQPASGRYGVLYPLQSLRSEIRPFPEVPFLIDAPSAEDLAVIELFARSLSSQVQQADDSRRLKLHLGAVLVNNFTNYLYTLAEEFCRSEKIDFALLLPLIDETSGRLKRYAPRTVQTGPAARGDQATIARHRDLLSGYENIKEVYDLFTQQIRQIYRPQDFPSVE